IGTGNYVVYNGNGTSVTVTGLSASPTYHFAIYEYNNTGVCYLSPALTGSGSTTAPPPLYFQSRQSGSWANISTWESSVDGNTWNNATTTPNAAVDLTITIRSPHEVNIPDDATLDQVVVDEGATLKVDNIADLTFSNGTGVDLDINGTYHDNATAANTASFNTGATWRQGPNSTFLKTNDSGSSVYRDAYEGGITNMPATAYWIVRDIGITLPSVSNMTYPNLTIENFSGATITCGFSGAAGFPTIKGNLDVGGSGTGEVIFDNLNTHATPCLVLGDVTVRSTSLLDNYSGTTYGTGFEVRGNITSEGFFDLTGGTGTKGTLLLSGGNAQTITGAGTVDANTITINKSANEVTLSSLPQQLWAHLNLTLTNRNIVLGNEVLRLLSGGTLSGGSAASYIKTDGTGYFERNVNNAETLFPVGNATYNPLWLTNAPTADDRFKVRVFDDVLADGTAGAPITTQVVDRTWIVNETTGGNTITMKAQWNAGDELTGFNRSACYISHYIGPGWSDDTPGAAAGTGPYTRTRTGITTFSPFALASDGQLPIELTHFRATPQGPSILLEWATQMERDNAYFAIERSADGQHFQQIGTQLSHGNSRNLQAYTHEDHAPLPGLNYYRLRQVDLDGRFTYSAVVKARMETASSLHLLSTLVSDELRAQCSEPLPSDARWQIVDASGRVLQSGLWVAESTQCPINVSGLAAGQYWLRVLVEDSAPAALKFQKQ
ncbi:MAG TPA: hypothetical protein PK971_11620, partial [Saprospiraceae bacterium]|nr:hypothetical protein [Saprospiraceae bacterium]